MREYEREERERDIARKESTQAGISCSDRLLDVEYVRIIQSRFRLRGWIQGSGSGQRTRDPVMG